MKSSKKILIITYYWPPSGGVGVQRWLNFTLQLQKIGWDPIVLTPENPQFEVRDEKLSERVKDVKTVKIPIWEPFNLFHKLTGNKDRENVQQGLVLEKSKRSLKDKLMIWVRGNMLVPDPRVFWVKSATIKAIELIKEEGIETIITTGPPHSIHLIGRKVKRATGIKWLADFRDPWSKWDVLEKLNTSDFVRGIHRRMERSVVKEADVVTTVTDSFAETLNGEVSIIHNGVSLDYVSNDQVVGTDFTIGYFGLLNEMRNPSQLWQLLDQMCREDEVFEKRLKIRIGGIIAQPIKDEIQGLERLQHCVEFLGYLPHETVMKEYQKCNLLLLLQNKTNNSPWILPLKVFEYLAANRMILCLGDRKGEIGKLVSGKDVGDVFSHTEIDLIRSFIMDVFENDRYPNHTDRLSLLDQYNHDNLVGKLEKLLLEL